jgi:hypothetical protein
MKIHVLFAKSICHSKEIEKNRKLLKGNHQMIEQLLKYSIAIILINITVKNDKPSNSQFK